MVQKLAKKASNKGLIALVVAAIAITGGIVIYGISRFGLVGQTTSPESGETTPKSQKVAALGRLEPEAEVISLFPPLALDGDRIAQILVKEGDRVKAGQLVAILDARDRLQTAVIQSQQQVKVAQAKLNQVEAGAKVGEINAQQASVERLQAQSQGDKTAQQQAIFRIEAQWSGDRIAQEATIKKLEAELKNAEAEYQRYQQIYFQGAVSNSLYDSKGLTVETAKQQVDEAKAVLNRINTTTSKELAEAKAGLARTNATGSKEVSQAKATLTSIAEVRPVDVAVAKTEIENAIATLKHAQTELAGAYIKAPMAGQIIKIHTRVGEKISTSGIADLGQTDQMMAVAEVYQTDIGKVKLGQQAVISSQAFAGELRGSVAQIGRQVIRQNVFSNQPGENLDRRVIEVKIRLSSEDSKRVAGFTNLQVQTAIEL